MVSKLLVGLSYQLQCPVTQNMTKNEFVVKLKR